MEIKNNNNKTDVFNFLKKNHQTLSLTESCTGGGLAKDFILLPGSSEILRGSLVAYQDESKINNLGVSADLINKHTSVSFEVAEEMCKKGIQFFDSDWCLATTGWAGPGGGTDADPVGTIYFAVCDKTSLWVERRTFKESNNREDLMNEAVNFAWFFLNSVIQKNSIGES